MVPEKLGLLRSGLRSLVKPAVWLRSGLRFQVNSMDFYLELHVFGAVPVRKKKMKFLYFPGLPLALLFHARALIGRTDGA